MTFEEVARLRNGDEVFWNDPDEGLCSRYIIIQTIEVKGDIVIIQEDDGTTLECFAEELT